MGDFTDVIAGIPEFTLPARIERFLSPTGAEILAVSPMAGGATLYQSSYMVQTTQGPVNIQFQIDAASIEEACQYWQAAARSAVEVFGVQMKEAQRRIVMPGSRAANSMPFKSIN